MGNTIYFETDNKKLSTRDNNLVIHSESEKLLDIPLSTIDSLVIKGRTTLTSPSIIKLIEHGVEITFLDYYGNYSCSINSNIKGNIEVRHNQLRLSDNKTEALKIAISIIHGKVSNQISVLDRYNRNYGHSQIIDDKINKLKNYRDFITIAQSIDMLRGYEGIASKEYFSCFNILIRNQDFEFKGRNYHPCKDNVNAMLSFIYGLLRHEIEKYIQLDGLDPYAGFMHTERSGKPSLSLDLMEEYRPYLADRLVIGIINNREIKPTDFDEDIKYGIICNETCKKKIISAWEKRKKETIKYNNDVVTFEKLIDNQVRLLVRHIKGIDKYKSFIWR